MQDKLIRKFIFLIGASSLICFIYLQINLHTTELPVLGEKPMCEMASVSPEVDLLKFCLEKLKYMITANFA